MQYEHEQTTSLQHMTRNDSKETQIGHRDLQNSLSFAVVLPVACALMLDGWGWGGFYLSVP